MSDNATLIRPTKLAYNMDGEIFKKMTELHFSNEIQGCLSVIEEVAGYKLSTSDCQPFSYFYNYLTNPQPNFITEWRNDETQEKWYHRFTNGILLDVQNSLACILYHYDQLLTLEETVI